MPVSEEEIREIRWVFFFGERTRQTRSSQLRTMYETFFSTAQIKATRGSARGRNTFTISDGPRRPVASNCPTGPALSCLSVRSAPRVLSLRGGTMRPCAGNQVAILGAHFRKPCVAEGAVIIIAISVDPPPIIIASVRTSGKGISETPPILNPSAPLNTVAGATVPSGPSRARNGLRLSLFSLMTSRENRASRRAPP